MHKLVLATVVAVGSFVALAPMAFAGEYAAMDCDELWYARNEIYADAGYCFKTERARAAFPDSCDGTWEGLDRSERREVSKIRQAEEDQNCDAAY